MSALAMDRPELRKLSQTGVLPRVFISLQGWLRVAPTATRLPLPWPALSGLVIALLHLEEPEMALASLLAADAYLRPGEVLWLSGDDIVPARAQFGAAFGTTAILLFPDGRGRASTTHQYNDSVVLDTAHRAYLNRHLEALALGRRGKLLFTFSYLRWLGQSKAASMLAGLQKWDVTP